MYYERYEDSPQDDPADVLMDDFDTDFSKDLLVPKISKQFPPASIQHDRREFGKNDPYFIEQERVNVNEPLHTFVLVESNTPSTPLPKATQATQGKFRTSDFVIGKSLSPPIVDSRHSEVHVAPKSKDTISVRFRKSKKLNSKDSSSLPATMSFNSDEIGDETSGEGEDSTQLMETGTEDYKLKY